MADEDYAYNMCSSILTGMKYHLVRIPMYHYSGDNNNNNNITNGMLIYKNDKILIKYSIYRSKSVGTIVNIGNDIRQLDHIDGLLS